MLALEGLAGQNDIMSYLAQRSPECWRQNNFLTPESQIQLEFVLALDKDVLWAGTELVVAYNSVILGFKINGFPW